MAAIGFNENALQALGQGLLAGPAAMYLFAFSIQHHRRRARRGVPGDRAGADDTDRLAAARRAPDALQAAGLVTVLAGSIWRKGSGRSLECNLSCPAKAGHAVRCGFSAQSLRPLEYWVTRLRG